LLKALEMFVNEDLDDVLRIYDARAEVITGAIAKFGVTALPRQFNPQALGNVTPRYSWQIDPAKLNITGQEVMQKLADTRPIGIGSMGAGAGGMRGRDPNATQGATQGAAPSGADAHAHSGRPSRDPNSFGFPVWQLKEGEDKMIAARLVEIFSAARRT
jgi:L-seryl-tRNA(Ser) seleniumtransferase